MQARKTRESAIHLQRQSLLFAVFLFSPLACAGEAEAWLSKMNNAVHSLNYSGTYVYINEGQLETMQIVHRKDKDGERERLLSMNGESREIIRQGGRVTCILPADRSVVTGKHKSATGLPTLMPESAANLKDYYEIEIIGVDRIAGYATVILSILPKDKLRYGYHLWLEKEHGMVLRSDIIDAQGKIMEQMMFTEINLRSPISAAMLEPTVAHDTFKVVMDDSAQAEGTPITNSRWSFRNIPKGFSVTSKVRKKMPMKKNDIEHFVLSDGLATVSVYIEKAGSGQGLEGSTRMGGVNAFGRTLKGHTITVMGEVPKQTVKLIADSVFYR